MIAQEMIVCMPGVLEDACILIKDVWVAYVCCTYVNNQNGWLQSEWKNRTVQLCL